MAFSQSTFIMKKNIKKKSTVQKKIAGVLKKHLLVEKKEKKNYASALISAGSILLIAVVVIASSLSGRFLSMGSFHFFADENRNLFGDLSHDNLATNMNEESFENFAGMMGHQVVFSPKSFQFKVSTFKKLAPQLLEFELQSEHGPYTPANLKTDHESKLHFFLISADLKDFQHLHPYFENGKWKVLAKMLYAGTYYAYADLTPLNTGKSVVYMAKLTAQKANEGLVNLPGVTPGLSSLNRTFTAKLTIDKPTVGQQSTLSFQLITRLGTPVQALWKYLGAFGHVVVVREGEAESFRHLHSLDQVPTETGNASEAQTDLILSNPSKGLISFSTTFTKPGRYTAFAQFNIAGLIYLFPITFEIK